MKKSDVLSRVEEVKSALTQSLANHNALLGRLAEAEHMLAMFELHEKSGESDVDLEMSNESKETCAA